MLYYSPMYDLATIHRINQPRAAVETETTRHCSYVASAKGVVLHSAKKRSTVFLSPDRARLFLTLVKVTRADSSGRDRLIETYFN